MRSRHNCFQQAMRVAVPVLLCALSACATVQLPQRANLAAADTSVRGCARWFDRFDAEVAAAGVIDFGARRVAGFPYLRSDRFSAALGVSAQPSAQTFDAWVARLRDLDSDGRAVELANLPTQRIGRLGVADRAAALARSQDCAERLAAVDLSEEGARALLVRRAQVEDDYSRTKRLLGLYGIAQWPFSRGIREWQRKTTLAFEAARAGERPRHPVIRYVPAEDGGYSRAEVSSLLERAAARPFGVPDLGAVERERLFATYAPQFEIETSGDYDRIGALFWGTSASPAVDLSKPTVYRKLAYARFGDRTLLQLVYTVWMPARPKSHAFDLLGGRLDGIVWRVTLVPDGDPVLFDTIHPCGCFHMFFPGPRLQPLPSPEPRIEWAYSPAAAPTLRDNERVLLSIQTRDHYLRNVSAAGPVGGIRYAFADYDSLRNLPLPEGGTRSAFGPDGLVPGTQRGERLLFWPMGIDSAGAMRQWGTHATAFVGRRHFDDADLIERRFRLLR